MVSNFNINIPKNQTLKDFSRGRNFVKGLASRSIVPVILLEACVEGGRTYQAYKRGGFTEARERITEEFLGALCWFSAIPAFSNLIDKFIGKKLVKLPETNFDTGKDALRNPVKNFINKFGNCLKFKPENIEKVIARYKFGKVLTSIILANCVVGFALPKLNQAITRYLLKTQPKNETVANENYVNQTHHSIEDFIDAKDKKNVPFNGISPQVLMNLAYNFENNPKYGLLSTDFGVWCGRAVCARNPYERKEVLFRDITSSYFYMFNMPVMAWALNKLEGIKSGRRLDPVGSKQVTDHLTQLLDANGGKMNSKAFRELLFGNIDNKSFITPSINKALRENNGVMELDEFLKLLPEVKTRYPEANIAEIEKFAKGMSELQPKLTGKAMISEKQIIDSFTQGAINIPEFLKNLIRCTTSDYNLFTGKVKESTFNNDLSFISEKSIRKIQNDVTDYIETIIKKAKGGEITKELITKIGKENYIKNAVNWGSGFVISALFLSTFIPKIQYWLTRRATGSDAFPGTADYSNKK